MASRGNVPPAESLRWRGKELLIAERQLRSKKDHAAPNGMEINCTSSSVVKWSLNPRHHAGARPPGRFPAHDGAREKIWT